MPTRTFPPTPDRVDEDPSDDGFLDLLNADEDDERLEIVVTERGTDWSGGDTLVADGDDLDDPVIDPATLGLPGDVRVGRFFEAVNRATGAGGDVATLADLDRPGVAAFRAAFAGLPARTRGAIARRVAASADERFDLQYRRVFEVFLGDRDDTVRQFGVVGLADEDQGELAAELVRLLESDGSTDVRSSAASALAGAAELAAAGDDVGIDADELQDVLATIALDEDESDQLRRAVLETWAVFGSRGATAFSVDVAEAIAERYNAGETNGQASALRAMGRTLDPRWLAFVERDLASDEAELRLAAAIAAGQLADTGLIEPLALLATDDDDEVRAATVASLGQIGGQGAIRVLRALAADPERDDHDAIEEATSEATLSLEAI